MLPRWQFSQVVDDGMCALTPTGAVGEIWIRSKQVMKGYWNMPEETAKSITPDGWFRSGDGGYMVDGYVYINDRIKDMIIRGGINIYPGDIESVLLQADGVSEAAVVPIPSKELGEEIAAFVTVRLPLAISRVTRTA